MNFKGQKNNFGKTLIVLKKNSIFSAKFYDLYLDLAIFMFRLYFLT